MTAEISFLVRSWLITESGIFGFLGRSCDSSTRPGVVSTRTMTSLPSLSTVFTRALILACSDTAPSASACSISPIVANAMPSPFSPSRPSVR